MSDMNRLIRLASEDDKAFSDLQSEADRFGFFILKKPNSDIGNFMSSLQNCLKSFDHIFVGDNTDKICVTFPQKEFSVSHEMTGNFRGVELSCHFNLSAFESFEKKGNFNFKVEVYSVFSVTRNTMWTVLPNGILNNPEMTKYVAIEFYWNIQRINNTEDFVFDFFGNSLPEGVWRKHLQLGKDQTFPDSLNEYLTLRGK
jgi:hypothetical protein